MANSLTNYDGHGFWAKDAPLQVWLSVLLDCIEKTGSIPIWIAALTEHWKNHSLLPIGGAVNPGLEDYIHSDEDRNWLIEASSKALQRVKDFAPGESQMAMITDFGITVPSNRENQGSWTAYIEAVGESFIMLLQGTLDSPLPNAIFVVNPKPTL